MTVKEMLDKKYYEWLKNINRISWKNVKAYAEAKKMTIPQYMYSCLEITQDDIKANGGYNGELFCELRKMHENKEVASNSHRQYNGKVDCYWLTKKGLKKYAEQI